MFDRKAFYDSRARLRPAEQKRRWASEHLLERVLQFADALLQVDQTLAEGRHLLLRRGQLRFQIHSPLDGQSWWRAGALWRFRRQGALSAMMGPQFRVTQNHGKVFTDTQWAPQFMATLHPSALLRIPDAKLREESYNQFIHDLKIAAKQIGSALER